MSLIQCPECKKEASSQAIACPHCGYPLTAAENKNVPPISAGPPQPLPIQSQGQIPPINSVTPLNPKKKISKQSLVFWACFAVITVVILLVEFGAFTSKPSQDPSSNSLQDSSLSEPPDKIPKTIKVTPGEVIFGAWNDLKDFNDAGMQIAHTDTSAFQKAHPDGGTDADGKAFAAQVQHDFESLKTKFEAENRILNVPVGSAIMIVKFYDKTGNEITPVWNGPQKMFYAPDDGFVYPSGNWEGKTVYILKINPSDSDGW